MDYTAQELFDLLNDTDECPFVEAKGGHESSHSVMETVCAFSNEPGLGGGYILMGAAFDETSPFPQYKVIAVPDPDKFQRDFASQCASMFNLPVRPQVEVKKINGKTVIKIWVNELPERQKPLFFKSKGLPSGAMRRIGSTDQHCTEDDMHVFYQDYSSYDTVPVKGTSLKDVDEHAVKRYQTLRSKINPVAEELNFNTEELLEALGCVNKKNKTELNLSGLILFGTHKAQRTNFPMMRVDYIRVPGNEWLQEPDDRFISIDMRGSAILLLYRLIDAINADLPKGFLLPESGIQAESVGLPLKALREAIVNALMHRSYREHRPIQVIRYDNRIEIINPGYSIKSQDKLGEPGSETRNPFIAAVFHETNLAETKGSGIRAMRRLMRKANLVPPTFESDRENNQFTVRLLLHHFFSEDDLKWLKQFRHFKLTNNQKLALVFVKEVGAIDNQTYRQMADCDIIKAGSDLRNLKEKLLLKKKGKAKATYYIAGKELSAEAKALSTQADALSTQPHDLSTQPKGLSAQLQGLSTQAQELNTQPLKLSTQLTIHIPVELINEIESLKQKERDYNKIAVIIKKLCSIMTLTSDELAEILNRREDYLRRKYLNRLIKEKELQYKYQEMINHPEQAYKTIKK